MSDLPKPFRAGFVAILGKPNSGKSTLMNRIVGAKLAAVSALPQTTRERLSGIHTTDEFQIIFVDLPGMIKPTDRLNECLRMNVLEGIADVDVVLHLVDVADEKPVSPEIEEALAAVRQPLILAVNKLDGPNAKVDAGSWAGERLGKEVRKRHLTVIGLSAREGKGIDVLLAEIARHLPESPPLYDPEVLTDRDLRYLAQEMIREKVFLHLHQELPYSIAVEISEFKERDRGKWYIAATIFVERDSQKGIVIGDKGATLRQISTEARAEIERLCDAAVYLELWVKVKPKWRKNDAALRRFGFRPPKP